MGNKLPLSPDQLVSEENVEELRKKIQTQVITSFYHHLDVLYNCSNWYAVIWFSTAKLNLLTSDIRNCFDYVVDDAK